MTTSKKKAAPKKSSSQKIYSGSDKETPLQAKQEKKKRGTPFEQMVGEGVNQRIATDSANDTSWFAKPESQVVSPNTATDAPDALQYVDHTAIMSRTNRIIEFINKQGYTIKTSSVVGLELRIVAELPRVGKMKPVDPMI